MVAGLAGDQEVSAVLASLVDKSMVLADGADPARFRMLEPLRQYAAARLSRTGRAEIVATRACPLLLRAGNAARRPAGRS